jgi:AbrB family looped-hinge helix DNA binding protein
MATVTRLTTKHQTTKHQTTIPVEVRRALDLKAGDQVEFSVEGSIVTLRKGGATPVRRSGVPPGQGARHARFGHAAGRRGIP